MKRSTNAPRHFLDIDRIEAGTLRRILDMARAMKKAGKRVPAKLRPRASPTRC
jgi:ornithine carbamoyltransferase